MAKKQISNYKFYPGVIPPAYNEYPNAVALLEANKSFIIAEALGYTDFGYETPLSAPTAYPNAIAQLTNNKEFIKEEANAWVLNQIATSQSPFVGYTYTSTQQTKCKRDIGYLIDAFLVDLAGGGNAETIRISRMFYLNGDPQLLNPTQEAAVHTFVKTLIASYVMPETAYTTNQSPVVAAQDTSASAGEAGAITRLNTLNDIVIDLITNGLSSLPSISYNYNALYVGDSYNRTKCERDITYVLDSYIYDLTYGGNSLTTYVAGRYYVNGVIQLTNSGVEIATQTFIQDLINDYVFINKYHANYQLDVEQTILSNDAEAAGESQFTTLSDIIIDTITSGTSNIPTPVAPSSQNGTLLSNAVALIESNKRFIQEEAIAYIQYNIDNNIVPFVYYTYNSEKCRRDISYVLEGYISDLQHGGNRQTIFNASKYWENGVAQVDGDRQPEIYTHTFIRDLIENYIWDNLAYTPKQILVSQVFDIVNTPETFANTRLKELSNTILDVITNGVSYLPTKVSNRGYVKLPGFFKLKDFLLITNASRNIIMYNFADDHVAAEVTYSEEFDNDFAGALYGNDKITTITFDIDTSSMMVTDNIQIFVEGKEQTVRLNSIGTDAMERMKVGLPQSMLDADFEYGLQPTKWQALALMRNYPSIYEIPGSDIAVTNVVTDASTGTGGTGASLITVTTQNAHGFAIGDAITIKALANTISGFSRAEGSFLISTIPSLTQFTYYAKSKVGTSNGQVLASTYTQLRRGNFYTGAAIGNPTFSVYSSGFSGSVTTALITSLGRDIIGFTGSPPPVGSPLSGSAALTSGAQVTAVAGSGGITASTSLTTKALSGSTSLTVNSTTGISPGLLFDRGDGVGVTVTDVSGNVVSIGGALTSTIIGTAENYAGLTQSATTGSGSGAVFTVARSGGTYSTTVTNTGNGYVALDTITILGTSLGGTTTTNDATITVDSASPINSVATLNNGSLVGGTGYVTTSETGVATSVAPTGGTGLTVDITTDGSSVLTVAINSTGTGYTVGDVITILSGNSDATITVGSITLGGSITSVSTSGTPITAPTKDFYSAFTISEPTVAQISSGDTSITYSAISTIQVTFTSAHGFIPGDTITVQISSTGTGAQLAAGPYFVEQVPDSTTLRYTARAAGTIDNTLVGVIYGRPDSYFVHRPFDGGVLLGTAGPAHGASAIRMSKKYIRYQSGKGCMYNTGALFAPSYDIRSITATGTAVGSVITVVTDDVDHGCQVGGGITIYGATTSGYNGNYTVTDVANERQFSVIASQPLGATTAVLGTPCQMSVRSWHGATVRAGIFDDQNGMFWQYDGIRMAVCRRSSTFQLAGTIAIAANSNTVVGNNTRFTSQLAAGDRVVIRGMSHVVSQIVSDTSMYVTPDYRGVTNLTEAKIVKTIDLVVPQENWNLDSLNGAGPSGYVIDVTKMQMIGLQHTWYGAGFIDFMLRGPDGNYTFAHRFRNTNVNTEAYMRTGNQPVRYEVINEGARDKLSAAINDATTTIPLSNAYWFPTSGTVIIDAELIRYTGNTGTALTGCTRGTSLTQFVAGSQRNFSGSSATSHTISTGVILVSNTITPNISHWGSAYMIDGQFDSDRGYIFNYASTAISASTDKTTAFLIRLAPSVSNAQTGDLGEKELLNRAQLLLSSISVTSDSVSSVDPFTGNTWSSGGTATSGLYYSNVSSGVKNWYQATSTGTFSSTAPTFTSGTGVSGTYGVNLTWAGATPNNAGALVVEGILNPSNYPTDPTKITWTGLSSSAAGGQPSFAQIASGGSVTWSGNITSTTATIQGAFTTTLTAKSFAASTQTITAKSFNTVTNNVTAFSSTTNITYRRALSNTRTDFIIPDSQYTTLLSTTPIVVGDSVSEATYMSTPRTITSITTSYTTILGTPYTRIVLSSAPTFSSNNASFDGSDNVTVTITSAASTRFNTAISNARTDFLITQTQYASVTINNADTLSATTFLTGGQSISAITPNYVTVNGVAYARIVMTGNGTASSTSGSGNDVTVTVTLASTSTYNRALNTARTDFLVTNTEYDASGIATSDVLSVATYITGGQTISSITRSYVNIGGTDYTRIVMSAVANASSTAGTGNDITVTVTAAGTAASYVRTNYLFFTSASWIASGATVGTRVSTATTTFPAGTSVAATSTRTFGATTVYRVSFTQSSTGTNSASGTVTFTFGAQYALPGEQVFSFISNPGNTDTLSLEALKELTSTAIGGRGTFPNGPDVLAINVYKVAGSSTPTNLILRWGEAQA